MLANEDAVSELITINECASSNIENREKRKTTDDEQKIINLQESSNDESSSADNNDSNKVFTINDIQTLMNNQLIHKSQLDQNLENNNLEQQHLILVTQNGDKIILIQNPNTVGAQNQMQINSICTEEEQIGNSELLEKHNHNSEDNDLLLSATVSNSSDLNEKMEKTRVLMQHKARQQMLMQLLNRLREKHKGKFLNNEIVVSNQQQMPLSPSQCDDSFWDFNNDIIDLNEVNDQVKNSKSKNNCKKKSIPLEKFYCDAKWYPTLCSYLFKASCYMKRRSENIEQLRKFFPSPSYTFETRCTELKRNLNKLELNLERFQNVLGKDLHFIEEKLTSFFQDYHLESIAFEIEEQDKEDLKNLNIDIESNDTVQTSKISQININQLSSQQYLSKMELITPTSISIIPTERETDEIDPVPEVRDIPCDESLEEMGRLYSNNVISNKNFSPVSINIKTRKLARKTKDEFDMKHCKYLKRS